MDFCEFISKPESWLAIITAATAIFAIWQTRKQIKLSNKQHLMDRRLKNYVLVSRLIENYGYARSEIDLDNLESTVMNVVKILALRTELWDIQYFDIAKQGETMLNKLHHKLANVKQAATEIPIVFESNDAKLIAGFVEDISLFYLKCIAYNAVLEVNKNNKDEELKLKEEEEKLKIFFNNLELNYSKIRETKALEKLLKQIELK